MAIQKEVENEYGIDFKYHKISKVQIINNDAGVTLRMTVNSYADKQARIDGKQPTTRECIINGADFAMTPFYQLLKAKFPSFQDGNDDFEDDFKVKVYTEKTLTEQNDHGAIAQWREE